MTLYDGREVEIHIIPLKGYFTLGEKSTSFDFLDALRTDIFSDGGQEIYAVSVNDKIPDIGSDEYYSWVEDRRDSTFNRIWLSDIEALDWDYLTVGADEADDYVRLSMIVDLLEQRGIYVEKDVYECLDELKPTLKKPIRCVETGEVFESVRDCSNKMDIPYMTIYNCGKNKNAHNTTGLHFEKVDRRARK